MINTLDKPLQMYTHMTNNMFYYCHILLIALLQALNIEMFVTEQTHLV